MVLVRAEGAAGGGGGVVSFAGDGGACAGGVLAQLVTVSVLVSVFVSAFVTVIVEAAGHAVDPFRAKTVVAGGEGLAFSLLLAFAGDVELFFEGYLVPSSGFAGSVVFPLGAGGAGASLR